MAHTIELENRTLILSDDDLWKIYRYQEQKFHEEDVKDAITRKCNDEEEIAKSYLDDEELIKDIVSTYEDAISNDPSWNDLIECAIDGYITSEEIEQRIEDYENCDPTADD